MIPSLKFYQFLTIGIIIAVVISVFSHVDNGIFTVLLYDIALLFLMAIDRQKIIKNKVVITRIPLHRLSIGQDNPVILTINNPTNKKANILVQDNYPIQFKSSDFILKATVEPNTTTEITYNINPNSRGEFSWGNIQVRQLGQWGLGWYSWQILAAQKVAVYPDLIGLRSLSIRLALQNTGTMRQIRRLGQGTEFVELRQYSIGDDTRFIDWKATAKRSLPLIRVLEPEREQTLIILLDRGRLMTAQVQGLKRFDWGLNTTLSLALTGLHRGDRVGVGIFDREVTTWIPPETGQHQLPKLIERLTPIQPVLLEPDYVGAITKLVTQRTRRALVVLITDIVDATASVELLSAMQRLTPRYLPFCVTLKDPLVDKIAHSSTQNLEDSYNRAVALDLLAQRQVAFAKLKQKGVLVLDAPANQMSEKLVEQYLQIKVRGLL